MSVTRWSETCDLYIYEATEGWYILGPENCGPVDTDEACREVTRLVEEGAEINRPLEDILEDIRSDDWEKK